MNQNHLRALVKSSLNEILVVFLVAFAFLISNLLLEVGCFCQTVKTFRMIRAMFTLFSWLLIGSYLKVNIFTAELQSWREKRQSFSKFGQFLLKFYKKKVIKVSLNRYSTKVTGGCT